MEQEIFVTGDNFMGILLTVSAELCHWLIRISLNAAPVPAKVAGLESSSQLLHSVAFTSLS